MSAHVREEILALHVRGDLREDDRRSVTEHIGGCRECKQVLADLSFSSELLTNSLNDPTAAELAALRSAVMSNIRVGAADSRSWVWMFAAAAAILLCLAALIWRGERQEFPPVARLPRPEPPVVTPLLEPSITAPPTEVARAPRKRIEPGMRAATLITKAGEPDYLKMNTSDPNVVILMTPVLLWSQAKEPTPPTEIVTKVIRIHNANPNAVATMASVGSPVSIRADNMMKAVIIRGKSSDVADLEKVIQELDTVCTAAAERNVELMVYIVSGSNTTSTPSTPAEKLAGLAPVVKQLRAIFPYNDYQLLSTMLLRSGEGTMTTSNGLLKPFHSAHNGSSPSVYSIGYESATVPQQGARPTIHLQKFRFDTRFPMEISATQTQNYGAGIQADVDLQEGQKVVVGKANIESTDSALFVILSAKLVP